MRRQIKKRLDDAEGEEKARLEEELHIADVDWHYAKYFPFMERYVGLYLAAKTPEASDDKPIAKRALHAERPPVWKEIETAMEQGERALVMIQEREVSQTVSRQQDSSGKKAKEKTGQEEKSKPKEKKQGESKPGGLERQDIAAHGGKKAKQEKEEQVAEEGHDGMGFFAVA